MSEWQDIETAPYGVPILVGIAPGGLVRWGGPYATAMVYSAGFVAQGVVYINPQTFQREVRVGIEIADGITHWMPLPAPPPQEPR